MCPSVVLFSQYGAVRFSVLRVQTRNRTSSSKEEEERGKMKQLEVGKLVDSFVLLQSQEIYIR